MSQPFRVFICSTFSDLSDERSFLLEALRRLQIQYDSMEYFGACSETPFETCLAEVRKSDVLIVLVGFCYGSILPQLGVSYPEAEYAEGARLEKPCLIYFRDATVPILPLHIDRDYDKIQLLDRWKSLLEERHPIATFSDGNGLAKQVTTDLSRLIQDAEVSNSGAAVRPAARHIIDCNVNPRPLIGSNEDWTLLEHQRLGSFEWKPEVVPVYLIPDSEFKGSIGPVFPNLGKYKSQLAGKLTLNAIVWEYLFYQHQYLIPESWREKVNFYTKVVPFTGTVYRDKLGNRWIRCFYWQDDRLSDQARFGTDVPVAIRWFLKSFWESS